VRHNWKIEGSQNRHVRLRKVESFRHYHAKSGISY
jgi:hypothetical protein